MFKRAMVAAGVAALILAGVAGQALASPRSAQVASTVVEVTTTDPGIAAFSQYCPYKLNSGVTSINIRTGPGTNYPVVDWWLRSETRWMGHPPRYSGSWQQMDTNRWVSRSFIHRVSGPCFI